MSRSDRKSSTVRGRFRNALRTPENFVTAVAGVGGTAIEGSGNFSILRSSLAVAVPLGFEVLVLGVLFPFLPALRYLWTTRKPVSLVEVPWRD